MAAPASLSRLLALVLLAACLAGCGGGVRTYRSEALEHMPGLSIAVLPFSNLSEDGLAGDAVGFAVVQEMMNRKGYRVTPPSRVNEVMAELRIRYAERMTTEQVRTLGRRLGAEGLLVGAVDTYEYRVEGGEEVASVSLHMRIIETGGGDVIWAADHHRAGNDRETILGFGLVDSLADLGQKVVREMIATLPSLSGRD